MRAPDVIVIDPSYLADKKMETITVRFGEKRWRGVTYEIDRESNWSIILRRSK